LQAAGHDNIVLIVDGDVFVGCPTVRFFRLHKAMSRNLEGFVKNTGLGRAPQAARKTVAYVDGASQHEAAIGQ